MEEGKPMALYDRKREDWATCKTILRGLKTSFW